MLNVCDVWKVKGQKKVFILFEAERSEDCAQFRFFFRELTPFFLALLTKTTTKSLYYKSFVDLLLVFESNLIQARCIAFQSLIFTIKRKLQVLVFMCYFIFWFMIGHRTSSWKLQNGEEKHWVGFYIYRVGFCWVFS